MIKILLLTSFSISAFGISILVFFLRRGRYALITSAAFFFCSVFFLCAVTQQSGIYPEVPYHPFFSLLLSSVQAFTLDANYSNIFAGLQKSGVPYVISHIYSVLILLLAPIVGGAAILSILADIFPTLKFAIVKWIVPELYVFSSLDKRTLSIAEYLSTEWRKKGPAFYYRLRRNQIVFAGIQLGNGSSVNSELISDVHTIGAICLKEDLFHLRTGRKKHVTYFLSSANDLQNIKDTVRLVRRDGQHLWKQDTVVSIYLYVQNDWCSDTIENLMNSHSDSKLTDVSITIVPYKTNAIYHALASFPLLFSLNLSPEEDETLTVTVVGEDDWAIEFYRTVFWLAQIPEKHLRLVSLTSNKKRMEERIRYLIPELDEKDSGVSYCQPVFLTASPFTSQFDDVVTRMLAPDCRVWFVSLGNDSQNIDTAKHIGHRIASSNQHNNSQNIPIIHCIVEDDTLTHSLNIMSNENSLCHFHTFGAKSEQLPLHMLHSDIHEFASILDAAWEERKGFWSSESEYHRRSSFAAALHIESKLYCFGLWHGDPNDNSADRMEQSLSMIANHHFTVKERYLLGYAEHRRWNAYMRSIGYRRFPLEDWKRLCQETRVVATRYPEQKLHVCLVEYRKEPGDPVFLCMQDQTVNLKEYNPARYAKLDPLDLVSWTKFCLTDGRDFDDLKQYDCSLEKPSEQFLVFSSIRRGLLSMGFPPSIIHFYSSLEDILQSSNGRLMKKFSLKKQRAMLDYVCLDLQNHCSGELLARCLDNIRQLQVSIPNNRMKQTVNTAEPASTYTISNLVSDILKLN